MVYRFALLIACVSVTLFAAASPALADISLTSITPDTASAASTASCIIAGHFPGPERPLFTLSPRTAGVPTIEGVTAAVWTAAEARVAFALPEGSDGDYDVVVQQGASWTAVFGAFRIYPARPVIESLAPSSAPAGSPDLTLTVHGRYFRGADARPWEALIFWNGAALPTTVVSDSVLRTTVQAARLASPGAAAVTVRNVLGDKGGPASDALSFTVSVPTPAAAALDPSSAVVGGPAFDLGVTGSGFVVAGSASSYVFWNDAALVTTQDSATHLTATVPATLLLAAGTAFITVRNGRDEALRSNALPFVVGNALPTVTTLSPARVWAGCTRPDLALTVTGRGFLSGAHVCLGAVEKTATSFVSATKLTVPLAAADIATPGTIKVGVRNPPFPPGTPSAATLPLTVQAETSDPTVTVVGADAGWHNVPVALTFTVTDAESGVQKVHFMAPPAVSAWTSGTTYVVPTSTQGAITVSVRGIDWCDRIGTASATVHIDTTRPETATLGNASVRRGKAAKLRYRISEPSDLSPSADVVITIKRSNGRTVKTIPVAAGPMNSDRTCSFTCRLARGTYRWYVAATDLAGNREANVASAQLRVR
jgi:hypothetical protein